MKRELNNNWNGKSLAFNVWQSGTIVCSLKIPLGMVIQLTKLKCFFDGEENILPTRNKFLIRRGVINRLIS